MNDLAIFDDKSKRERSPSYPFISLKKAVARAEQLSEAHKKHPVRLITAAETWGYGERSSGLLQTAAALKQYGLIEDSGSGSDRRIQLTELASKILTDTRPGERENALKVAAKNPRIFLEYIEKWIPDRPNDSHCISELSLDRGFTKESAKSFVKVFDETVSFANLHDDDTLSTSLSSYSEDDVIQESANYTDNRAINLPVATTKQTSVKVLNRATFPLTDGLATLDLPEKLSAEDVEDLKAWFEILLKRASRA